MRDESGANQGSWVHRRPAPSRIRAVVVHYGPTELVEACVRSLVDFAPGIEIVVVDHGDEPLNATWEYGPGSGISIVRPAANSGYGSGCNAGALGCTREFLLFLNNDVALLEGSVDVLVNALHENVQATVAAPLLVDETGRSLPSVHRLPSPWRLLMENVPVGRLFPFVRGLEGNNSVRQPGPRRCEVEAVLGAAFLVRRTEFEEVGGFDEGFFHYVEEDDLFRRMRDRNRRIVFVPEAHIVHSGSVASQGISLPIRDRWKVDGFLRYAAKHHGGRGRRRTYCSLLLGAQIRLLMARMTRSGTATRRERFRQLVQYLRSIQP
jgi:N-acetylglucosaminyl-diphospho-decaprenol L-rhamnosyltransferase